MQVHGILMVVGFGILVPIGVLVARTLKPLDPLWFHLHRIIQVKLQHQHMHACQVMLMSNTPTWLFCVCAHVSTCVSGVHCLLHY